jgi:hypothetical protein
MQTYDLDGTTKDARDPKSGTPAQPIIPRPGEFFPKEKFV